VDMSKGDLSMTLYREIRQKFEALGHRPDAFPATLYARRWVIILAWITNRIDAPHAVDRLNSLAATQTDEAEVNLTRAYTAVILARDGHMARAHDAFMACAPAQTPQWGWFVFELNKYMNGYVGDCEPNIDRMINGRLTQKGRTDQQWQSIETDLRAAQTAYADYVEYELLPSVVEFVNHPPANHYDLIRSRVNIGPFLRTLLNQHLGSFSLGKTTKTIERRVREQIQPKILAAWHGSLQLFDAEQKADQIDAARKDIKALCKKTGLSMETLPTW
jgi:hypothetical protein